MSDEISGFAKVIEKVYDDALSPAFKEVGKIGADTAKIIRMMLFPLQYGGAFQDRLERYIAKAVSKVPEQNRIAPVESLALPIAEKLKFQEESNPISELYVNLLARAMDKERVGEAHPAFIFIISQLAPTEIAILEVFYKFNSRLLYRNSDAKCLATKEQANEFLAHYVPEVVQSILLEISYDYESIHQPEIFLTLIEHLYTLGLICYDDEFLKQPLISSFYYEEAWINLYPLEITGFGKLFYNACINNQ